MKKLMVGLLVTFSSWAGANCEVKLPAGWNSSSVEVPFDWSKPAGEKIRVAYYFKDQSQYPGKAPIVFFNGGPTMAGTSAIGLFEKDFLSENMIFLDQRGTGCSTAFKKYSGDPDIYKFYASDSIVRDAEVIREKLFGNKTWKIFGQSYGGLISFRYLELFPKSITSAHIHGFGFSPDSGLVDAREKRIEEITPQILKYRNTKVSDQSIGDLITKLSASETYRNLCIETKNSLKKKFCGEDLFTGLFMVTGFKDRWKTVHKYFANFVKLLEEGNNEELEKSFVQFSRTYILRFGSIEQTAALHAITYYELIPGKFFYNACSGRIENDLISECKFGKSFLIRTNETPDFAPNPHNLTTIRENIRNHEVPVYYYAGEYDTFLPVNVLKWTADVLELQDSFVIFPKSGHEGFYSEQLVLENVKR